MAKVDHMWRLNQILDEVIKIRMDSRNGTAKMRVYHNRLNEIKDVINNKIEMVETKMLARELYELRQKQ